jgi:hypothetical protein
LPLAASYYSLNQIEISNRLSRKSARIRPRARRLRQPLVALTRPGRWRDRREAGGANKSMDSGGREEGSTEVDFRATAGAGSRAPETTRPCHQRHRERQAAAEEGVIEVGSYADPGSSGRRPEGGDWTPQTVRGGGGGIGAWNGVQRPWGRRDSVTKLMITLGVSAVQSRTREKGRRAL